MTWLDFVCAALASHAIVDVWRNGSIFADWRALMQAKADAPMEPLEPSDMSESQAADEPLPWLQRAAWRCTPRWAAELLSCAFCFSHHTPWLLLALLWLPATLLGGTWELALKLPIYSLAATRLGTVLNAIAPDDAKYNRE